MNIVENCDKKFKGLYLISSSMIDRPAYLSYIFYNLHYIVSKLLIYTKNAMSIMFLHGIG